MSTTKTTFDLMSLLRENIRNVKPYSSARDEHDGSEGIFLDANENAFGSVTSQPFHRYPDPLQRALKQRISRLKGVDANRIFLGNGSDEAIDLLMRAFCVPARDNILIMPPTYGMYEVCAAINDVKVKKVLLTNDFQLDVPSILQATDSNTKILFVCSPNNPTGNVFRKEDIITLLEQFQGIVVVDEAYIDFADAGSFVQELENYPNLVVLQTFSKAWGMAALRLGMAYSSPELNKILNSIKFPYNVNQATQNYAMEALDHTERHEEIVKAVLEQRKWLFEALSELGTVEKIYPSDANFLLVRIKHAKEVYQALKKKLLIVRDRSGVALCESCLRITVGTPDENKQLISALKEMGA